MRVEIRLSHEATPSLAEPSEALLRAIANTVPEQRQVHQDTSVSGRQGTENTLKHRKLTIGRSWTGGH